MNIDNARDVLLRTEATYAPQVYKSADPHKALRANIEAAVEVLELLAPGADHHGRATADAVMTCRDQPLEVLRTLSAHDMPRRADDPHTRAQLGLDAERFTRRGQYPRARVAACLATELIWFFYAEGVEAARDSAPVESLRTDMHALATAVNYFAVADYPALAVAFGAALHSGDGGAGRWESFAALVDRLAQRHIGGPFASDHDRRNVTTASHRIAERVVQRMAEGGVPSFFTAPRLAGIMVDEIDAAVPHLELVAADPIGDFEEGTNHLVFDTIRNGSVSPDAMKALEELYAALRADL